MDERRREEKNNPFTDRNSRETRSRQTRYFSFCFSAARGSGRVAGKRCFERRYLRGDITSRPVSRSLYYAARCVSMGNERRRRFFNLSVEKQSIRIAIPFFWLMAAFENGFEIRPFVADPSISMTSLTITICTAYQFRSEARKYAAIFRQGKINDSSPSLRLIFEESRNRSSWKMY